MAEARLVSQKRGLGQNSPMSSPAPVRHHVFYDLRDFPLSEHRVPQASTASQSLIRRIKSFSKACTPKRRFIELTVFEIETLMIIF